MLIVLFLSWFWVSSVTAACHPECHWACDDPVCQAVCQPICDVPVCILVNASNPVCDSYQPSCAVQCPPNMCEADACPNCETICQPPSSLCNDGSLLCEAANCTWQCRKPTNCVYPQCELQCEHPACEGPTSSASKGESLLIGMLFLVAFLSA